jgi:hypothetical protein
MNIDEKEYLVKCHSRPPSTGTARRSLAQWRTTTFGIANVASAPARWGSTTMDGLLEALPHGSTSWHWQRMPIPAPG